MADRRQLTQRHIETLKHHPQRKVLSRTESGLYLILGMQPSKSRTWMLTYYIDGQKRRYAFGTYPTDFTLATARIERDRLKALVSQGICPKEQQRLQQTADTLARLNRTTMAKLRERFKSEHLDKRGRKSGAETLRTLIDKFSDWDNLEVKDINRMMITERLDNIETTAPVMRNRAHSYLRSMLSFAVEKSIIDSNPATNIRQAEEKPKTRCLTTDEIRYVWEQIGEQNLGASTVLALRLMLVTGQRGGEILSMEKSHITGNWWTQPNTKNGRAHRTYLTPKARKLVDEAMAVTKSEIYLFASRSDTTKSMRIDTLSKAVLRWVKHPEQPMQIPAWTPHDLRRTMASNLGSMEVGRFAQNQILNHKDTSIGGVYDVSEYDALKKRTMPLWETRLQSILEDRSDDNVMALHG